MQGALQRHEALLLIFDDQHTLLALHQLRNLGLIHTHLQCHPNTYTECLLVTCPSRINLVAFPDRGGAYTTIVCVVFA